ncbi:MAG: anhydro-N-acetylmuramic acid kinase [Bacteroidales bacterium]|nr:anhydro-N-acetylmuramic acid kinase [Bacteroidales bacterium]
MPVSKGKLVLGIMSGTSLDGVDLALCEFSENKSKIDYKLLHAETIPYPYYLKEKLEDALHLSTKDMHELDQDLGFYYAKLVKDFIKRAGTDAELIASHGHTVLHQPDKGITLQIGSGKILAEETGVTVINDFRARDVSKGGQGAPLVTIGDRDLFGEFDICLNLGGIANASFDHDNKRIACDITPCNMPLNTIASWIGIEYDRNGDIASRGSVHLDLLKRLNSIGYYELAPPKSIGKEWFLRIFLPEIRSTRIKFEDALRTVNEHIAVQLAGFMNKYSNPSSNILVTGGGVYNTYLIDLLKNKCAGRLVIPDDQLVNFKEAIIFAYLGYLRINNRINILASVTGAGSDTSAGKINHAK